MSSLYSSHAARNIGAKLEVEMLDTWLLVDIGIVAGDEREGFLGEDVPATQFQPTHALPVMHSHQDKYSNCREAFSIDLLRRTYYDRDPGSDVRSE